MTRTASPAGRRRGKPPKPAAQNLDHDRFVARGVFHSSRVRITHARGTVCWDADGRRYLDFAAGIGALNVGHCHPKVVAAIRAQADKLLHLCYHVALYDGYAELCRKLCELAPGDFPKKAVLFNSGAEAVENAVKIARRATGRSAVVSFAGSFHGRTALTMTLTGKERPYRLGFGPVAPEIYHASYPYAYRLPSGVPADRAGAYALERLDELFRASVDPARTAAIIVEPVQGEGGFIVPPPDFLPALRALCDRHGIVLILDEIQTGFGRTGKLFACEHFGVTPDLMTVAKSLAAGLPLSGVVGKAELLDAPEPGGLGGTYGGNPVACAAALAALEVIEGEDLSARARRIGELIGRRFAAWQARCPFIGEARGLGAMRAIELVADRGTRRPLAPERVAAILGACAGKGLLLIKAGIHGNVLRLLPPLTASDAEIEEGLAILESVLLGEEWK